MEESMTVGIARLPTNDSGFRGTILKKLQQEQKEVLKN